MTPQQLLHQSQIAMIQHRAHAEEAIVQARWRDAQTSLRHLRWEVSNAEEAISMIQAEAPAFPASIRAVTHHRAPAIDGWDQ